MSAAPSSDPFRNVDEALARVGDALDASGGRPVVPRRVVVLARARLSMPSPPSLHDAAPSSEREDATVSTRLPPPAPRWPMAVCGLIALVAGAIAVVKSPLAENPSFARAAARVELTHVPGR